ncbi:MAG: hypothetical protein PHQ39_13160, partial [Methanothrix soehngenii]|nr:hypothetical protein [Methanothrix soehngenii]
YRRDLAAIPLQKVDPAAYSRLRGREGDGSGMKGLKVFWDRILLGIDPAVEKSAFNSLSAILEFSLNPLKIAEPGAIGISCKHAGGDELRSCRGALILNVFCQILASWSDKEDYILDKYV